jgi:hypothetical protein
MMAQQRLDHPRVDPRFQQMRRIAMPQRLSTMLIHRRYESATGIIHFSTMKVTSCGDFADASKTATLSS